MRIKWKRVALLGGALFVVVVLALGIGLYAYTHGLDSRLRRTDAFAGLTGGRPAKKVDGVQNILVLGSDSRDPSNLEKQGEWRTDTIMLLHINKAHDKAYVISVPRDLYVHIPENPNGGNGNTNAKINAAYAWGGLPLIVKTMEEFSGIRIDHVAVIDFAGFKAMTDAVDGVEMYIEQDVRSIHPPYRQFKKGNNHLSGDEALDYVRQRKQFGEGDFARMRHQQQFIKALMDKAVSTGTLSDPRKLDAFLKAATKSMVVDEDFKLVDMAVQFRNLRSDNLRFMTSPTAGTDIRDGQDVVVSDREKAASLYDAINRDETEQWITENPPKSN